MSVKFNSMNVPFAILHSDESRFGLKTVVGTLITASGVKPIGQSPWQFKAFWLYGAVEPLTGEHFICQFSHVDTDCYQQFLNEFSKAYPDSLNILQVDNGRFHKRLATASARKYHQVISTASLSRVKSH